MKKKLVLFLAVFVCCTLNSSTYTYDECVKLTLSPGDYKKWLNDEIDLSRYSELIKKCLDEEIKFSIDEFTNNIETGSTVIVTTTTTTVPPKTTTTLSYQNYPTYSETAIEAYLEILNRSYELIPIWERTNIKIELLGNPSPIQRDTFNYVIGDLNRIIPEKTFQLVENSGDIKIYFGKFSTWGNAIDRQTYPLTEIIRWNFFYSTGTAGRFFDVVNIWIHNQFEYKDLDSFNTVDDLTIETCAIYDIRDSLASSLLIITKLDFVEYGQGVFSPTTCNPSSTAFSALDEELLMMHYDQRFKNSTSINALIEKVRLLSK